MGHKVPATLCQRWPSSGRSVVVLVRVSCSISLLYFILFFLLSLAVENAVRTFFAYTSIARIYIHIGIYVWMRMCHTFAGIVATTATGLQNEPLWSRVRRPK